MSSAPAQLLLLSLTRSLAQLLQEVSSASLAVLAGSACISSGAARFVSFTCFKSSLQ